MAASNTAIMAMIIIRLLDDAARFDVERMDHFLGDFVLRVPRPASICASPGCDFSGRVGDEFAAILALSVSMIAVCHGH